MGFEIKKNPVFSWSFSRNEMFESCKREYFYNYYGSHNGWLKEGTERSKEIYRHKNIQSLDLVFGSAVHDAIRQFLISSRDGVARSLTWENAFFANFVQQRLRDACKRDASGCWHGQPKQYPRLMETYYWGTTWSDDVPKSRVDNIKTKMAMLDKNIFESKTFKELSEGVIEKFIEIDESLNSPDSLGKCQIDNLTVYSKIDFLYKRNDGKVVIVDWKTSSDFNKTKELLQLKIYVHYVVDRYKIPVENIICRVENLILGSSYENVFDEDNVVGYIKNQITEMGGYIENADYAENVALPEESFEKNTKKCKLCKFKNVCK